MILEQGKYFGFQDKIRVLDDFIVTLSSYHQKQEIPVHQHESAYASVVLRGKYLEKERPTASGIEVRDAQIVFRQSGYEHANVFSNNGGACLNIELKNSHQDALGLFKLLNEGYRSSPPTVEIARVVNAVLCGYEDDELECLINEFFSSVLMQNSVAKDSQVVHGATSFISDNFTRTLTLDEIAKSVNVHPVYLARAFKSKMNITIGEFIRNKRITSSYFNLFEPQNTLTGTAISSGFFDQAHFIRTFKETFDQTPGSSRNFQRLI